MAPLWQAKWTVLLVAVLVAAPAIAATWLLVVPEYRARAEVRVRPIMPRLVFRTENSGLIPLYQSFMNTQVSIIRNPTVLQRVLEQPDVQATSWYRHLRADGQARSWYRRPRALLRRIAPPSPGADIERLQKALEVRARPRTEVIDISFTAENPADASIVTNAVLDQYVRYISDATDKTEKVILEQLTEEYNRLKGQIGSDEQTLADLREQLGTATPDELISQKRIRLDETNAALASLQQEVSVAEWRLRDLERDFGAILRDMGEAGKKETDKRLTEEHGFLAKELADLERPAAEARTAPLARDDAGAGKPGARGARASQIEAQREALRWEIAAVERELAILRQSAASPAATQPAARPIAERRYEEDAEWVRLRTEVLAARRRLEVERIGRRETHPSVVKLAKVVELAERELRARQAELDLRRRTHPVLPEETRRGQVDILGALAGARRTTRLLKHREKLLVAAWESQRMEFKGFFEAAEKLAKANETLRHERELFAAVRARLDQKRIEKRAPAAIEILARAFPQSEPERDRRFFFTVLSVFLGLGVGCGVVLLRDFARQAKYGTEDLVGASRAPFLGQLPLVPKSRRLSVREDPGLLEGVRMIRTALFSRLGERRGSAVLVSSAETKTGKSTLAMMLARSVAQCGESVLLVDADLRNPSLTGQFGARGRCGLVQCLFDAAADHEAIVATQTPELSFLPAGQRGDGTELELIANGAFSKCLERWRRAYDVIVLDSSPILPVADARILAQQVDGTIMVLREGRSQRAHVVDALACLGSSGGTLLGTVVIRADRTEDYYSGYHYRHGDGDTNR